MTSTNWCGSLPLRERDQTLYAWRNLLTDYQRQYLSYAMRQLRIRDVRLFWLTHVPIAGSADDPRYTLDSHAFAVMQRSRQRAAVASTTTTDTLTTAPQE
jgi:hypothetical protein